MRNGTRKNAHLGTRASFSLVVAPQRLNDLRLAVDRIGQTDEVDAPQLHEICIGLTALAHATRAAGLCTYCSLSLHVLEQLRAMIQGNYLSLPVMDALRAWISLSAEYLRKPQDSANALRLVENLGDRQWERPVGEAHRAVLLSGLNDDWTRVELRVMLGPQLRALRNFVLSMGGHHAIR